MKVITGLFQDQGVTLCGVDVHREENMTLRIKFPDEEPKTWRFTQDEATALYKAIAHKPGMVYYSNNLANNKPLAEVTGTHTYLPLDLGEVKVLTRDLRHLLLHQ